jgi:uncharacterized membrane protein
MNAAHLHLLVNHLPIVGLLIAFFTFLFGVIFKNSTVKRTALCICILCSTSVFLANASGEEAEEQVEEIVGIDHRTIHEHEEAAEPLMPVAILTILASAVSLWSDLKQKSFTTKVQLFTFILMLAGVIISARAGYTGGMIRHPEAYNTAQTEHHEHNEHH